MIDDQEKNVLYGGPDPDNIGDGCRSIGEFFLKQMAKHGDKVAMVDGITSEETSYLEIRARAIRLARKLQASGITKNDVISIVSENRIEFPVALFAVFLCGATVAPINLTYSERKYIKLYYEYYVVA
jgi:4-coumarate--CoA ligase